MTLGILGGLGPLAGAHFYRRLIELTDADCDAAHIPVLLSGCGEIPDRTAYLLGKSEESPAPVLLREAKRLTDAGADILVLLCHTAHAFLPELRRALRIPLLHMPYIALRESAAHGLRRIGVLCTEGSFVAGVFQSAAASLGISLVYPTPNEREAISHLIYREIKCGKRHPCVVKFEIPPSFSKKNCEGILLGCTELSLLFSTAERHPSSAFFTLSYISAKQMFIDPIEILARVCIRLCGKRVKEEFV